MVEHPKTVAESHLRRLLQGPQGHYLREFAELWRGLEASDHFNIIQIEHQPFSPDAGRIYMKFHIRGLASGITQSVEEYQIRQWVTAYALRMGMWLDLRARYLRPQPEDRNGVLVHQTVLQQEVVVCHLLRGQRAPTPPPRPQSDTYRVWRSADHPERLPDAG